MKKAFALILAMLLTVTWWGGSAAEEKQTEYQSGDYSYVLLEDGTAEITDYEGGASDLGIPSRLDGYTVTSIGGGAFYGCESLSSVTIPDSVTVIWDNAFSECRSLSSVTIGMAVEYVGTNPFMDCQALEKIVVSPNHPLLATIDKALFHKLDKRLICYPGGLSGASYLVPDGIQSIGDSAFSWCRRLTSVTIPDSVTSIGDYAFTGCESLSSVTIPDSVTSIGDGAFNDCDKLTLIVGSNSFAKEYAIENDITYTYPDANNWLNN